MRVWLGMATLLSAAGKEEEGKHMNARTRTHLVPYDLYDRLDVVF